MVTMVVENSSLRWLLLLVAMVMVTLSLYFQVHIVCYGWLPRLHLGITVVAMASCQGYLHTTFRYMWLLWVVAMATYILLLGTCGCYGWLPRLLTFYFQVHVVAMAGCQGYLHSTFRYMWLLWLVAKTTYILLSGTWWWCWRVR